MNLIDLLALCGLALVLYGLVEQIKALITAMNLSKDMRLKTYRDMRPFAGFAAVFIGWLLTLFALGGAVKTGELSYIYVVTSLFNFAKLCLLVSGALLIVLFLVFGARMVAH